MSTPGRPPWHFRAAKWLIPRRRRLSIFRRLPGLWLRLAWNCGLLPRSVLYDLGAGVSVELPWDRWEYLWDEQETRCYEQSLLNALAPWVESSSDPIFLVDGGADVGLFTSLFAARFPGRLGHVLACEPSPSAFPLLTSNLARLPPSPGHIRHAVPVALSDSPGAGSLHRPDYDPHSQHACYFTPDPSGPLASDTVDRLLSSFPTPLQPTDRLLLKLDVEGGELPALQGSLHSLSSSPRWLAVLEAHPLVTSRTGVDPITFLTFLHPHLPFTTTVHPPLPHPLDPSRPFFSQAPPTIQHLLLASKPQGE